MPAIFAFNVRMHYQQGIRFDYGVIAMIKNITGLMTAIVSNTATNGNAFKIKINTQRGIVAV
jgi:hypothetical protein